MIELKDLSPEIKKNLFKAILRGDISKKDLECPQDIIRLYRAYNTLIWIKMGDFNSLTFEGQKISMDEFQRLSKLAQALGLPVMDGKANFNIEVIPSPYGIPLANSESEVKID